MGSIEISCDTCGKSFHRRLAEYNRSVALGRKNFCSRKCCGVNNVPNLGENRGNILNFGDKRFVKNLDDDSPFRYYIRRIKQRSFESNRQFDIDIPYLKNLWNECGEKCSISGVKIYLPNSEMAQYHKQYRASVDRINSSIGYIKGNVQFVCLMANLCKQSWDQETVVSFCKLASEGYLHKNNIDLISEHDLAYSNFSYFLSKSKSRDRTTNIDLEYLKTIWCRSGGKCAITGIRMSLPETNNDWQRDIYNPYKPSLDRINPSIGYVKENVQFVCMMANYCKQSWSDEQVVEFYNLVSKYNKSI